MYTLTINYTQKPDGGYQAQMEVPPNMNAQLAIMLLETQTQQILKGMDNTARKQGYDGAKAAPKAWKAAQKLEDILQLIDATNAGK